MKVSLKHVAIESRHLHHTIVTWVQVPPEIAFAYVADITCHHEWALDKIDVMPLTPGPVQLGSKYAVVGHQGGKEWPSEVEVTSYEPSHQFEFTATGGPIGTPEGDPHRHEFRFTPKNGGTELEVRRTDPAAPNWPTWFFNLFACLIMPILIRGRRIRTVERLRARLDDLADTQSSLTV
jgi:Polyketide cyclase / dehydrase and lipid transport